MVDIEKMFEAKRKAEICEFLNMSETAVDSYTGRELSEKVLDKLMKEGYNLDLNEEGSGFVFYKIY